MGVLPGRLLVNDEKAYEIKINFFVINSIPNNNFIDYVCTCIYCIPKFDSFHPVEITTWYIKYFANT